MASGIRISEDVFKGVCGLLFGTAMVAAIARTVIRYHNARRLAVDDGFLLFACVCLCAATGLLYVLIPGAYFFEELTFGEAVTMPSDFVSYVIFNVDILDAYIVISWAALFAVKFCFLAFFRLLIDRLTLMIIYWRCVVVITALLCGLSLCETFIACPHINIDSVQCLQGSGFNRTLAVSISVKCVDIVTDLMLLAIPICLLWNVRIKTRQKLGVGVFLCLSSVMVVLAIVKVSGLRTSVDSFDLVWKLFWTQVEASIAVMMVSFTAFRSLFVSNKTGAAMFRGSPASPGYFRRSNFWPYKKRSTEKSSLPNANVLSDEEFQLTLGTQFRDDRQKGFMASQLGMGNSMDSRDLESATYVSTNGETRASRDSEHAAYKVTNEHNSILRPNYDSNLGTSQPGSETLAGRTQDQSRSRQRNWWNMGLFTDFATSRSMV